MSISSVTVTLAGSGGAGVITAGSLLLDAAAKAGLYGVMTRSTGPQIRGGESAAMVRLAREPVTSHGDRHDLLVAIDWQNVERFADEVPLDGESLVIGDPAHGEPPAEIRAMGAREAQLPMQELAKGVEGGRPNMVALGAVAHLVGIPLEAFEAAVRKALGRKGEAAVTASMAALRAGAEAAEALPPTPRVAPAPEVAERWIITGNEAAGLGAVRGGVRFVAAYPITPATEVLEWLAPALQKVGGVLVQAEDELASINQVVGASYGGVPALTATSGPGLALMTETIGWGVAAEVPFVVIDVMRGGPSTGIPTKSEQSDLNIALYGLHGDAPHLVLAPVSVGDCLFTTQWAVHLAEALQTPAIVLSDQSLGQARAIIQRPADLAFIARRETPRANEEGYLRYRVTASGISPMAIPGTPGVQYTADGLEHNERGTPSSRAADHQAQLDKRQRKLLQHNYGAHWALVEGEGPLALVTWGSSTGPVREAAARLRAEGRPVRVVALRLLSPAQPERLAEALAGVERVLTVEQSHGAQFHRYLRAFYDLPGEVRSFHRPGPLPIRPRDIVETVHAWS
ncbi:2-oxoacid:acceptor oxidoreductase subunit alpha [Inmirania thermothiophila]|uniref:2-oxoglutarate ferredoxin oxidoreductase subunit alpha n=1 Tax=Inmirania thermothiophila TaxID=1750597 RepID=A0A3N1Y0X9_9GAMM|nr:2-oxoacid:acceptor oxidoreductase subunit alpha [Inmirania thermothiophila]ROR32485.1 2-oxoglutarate ferredoxin oxidoreductase subunit alpha [Inmirania thermothiophila]